MGSITRKSDNKAPTRSEEAHANKARPDRVSFSSVAKFTLPGWVKEKYPPEEYYFYYFTDNMIEQALAAGYEYIKTDDGERLGHASKNSDKVSERQILMAQPMEYHLQDVAEKEKKNRLLLAETESEIKGLKGAEFYKPQD